MSLRRSLGWMGGAQIFFVITQFIGSVALARLLTPFEMGVFALALSVLGLLALIQALGLVEFLVSQPDLTPKLIAGAFTVNTALAVVLAGLVASLGLLGADLFNDEGVSRVLTVIAVTPLIGVFEYRPTAMLQREARFKRLAVINMIRHLSSTIVTVILALNGFSYMSLAYGQVVGAVVGAVMVSALGMKHVSIAMDLTHWRQIVRFGLQMLTISGVNALAGRAGEIVLGRLLGLAALGLYSRASNLYSLLWNNVHTAIARVVLADFSRTKREGKSLRRLYLKAVAMLTGLLWPALLGLAVLAGPLISIIYGAKWGGAALPLSLLCISAVPLVAITMTWEVFVASGETARQARFEFMRAAFGLVAFTAGCFISVAAAAGGRIADATFSYFLYRPHLERMTETKFSDFAPLYLRSAVVTAAGVGPALAVMIFYRWSADIHPAIVFGSIAVGGVLWLLSLRLLKHPLYDEGMRMLAKARGLA